MKLDAEFINLQKLLHPNVWLKLDPLSCQNLNKTNVALHVLAQNISVHYVTYVIII